MKIFVDSASIDEISEAASLGIIDGVTTNPSLIAKNRGNVNDTIREICKIIDGDVSAEVIAEDYDGMITEGKFLYSLAENIVLKLPMTEAGLMVCKYFSNAGYKTNVTLCFSLNQAILAAKAGASYISPFVGRLDDIGQDGMELISEIKTAFLNYPHFRTKILAASIRNTEHVKKSSLLGADAVTIPPRIIYALYKHELTEKGLQIFRRDIDSANLNIVAS